MMIDKISNIYNNLVKREYVDEAKHWRHSSVRDYESILGLVKVERLW
jgi:hypothetical protein